MTYSTHSTHSTHSNCCSKKQTYSCYTTCCPTYQKTDYCSCSSCKPTYKKCCPKEEKCCPKKEEKCCIPVDYCGFLTDGQPVNNSPTGLYLDEEECILYTCYKGIVFNSVVPTKPVTKFLDCNTKELYKLVYGGEGVDDIECTLIKTVDPKDCLNLLCTETEPVSNED